MNFEKRYSLYFITIILIATSAIEINPATIKSTSRRFAQKTVSYQLDGYKHLAYIPILQNYCVNLLTEFKANIGSSQKIRDVLKEIDAIQRSDFESNNPFHLIENIIHSHDQGDEKQKKTKHYSKIQKQHWDNFDLSSISSCNFDENTIAITQACYHFFPSKEERDPGKQDLILISIGGRRTGMTKVLPLGREVHRILLEDFNLYSLTVEAEMFSKEEKYIHWRLANTLRAMVDTLQKINPQARPKIILGGYSYGGSHLINTINNFFTRKSFASYKPDLLLFVDPDGALNTLEHLHLVPIARRIVNFRGIYIVPQPKLRFIRKLITKTLDEYPSIEGTQPLVLLQKANYKEVVVYQPNNLDLSPHNRVPFDIVDYRDEQNRATYIEIVRTELKNLSLENESE